METTEMLDLYYKLLDLVIRDDISKDTEVILIKHMDLILTKILEN